MSAITVKGHLVHLEGTFPKAKDKAPDFVLVNTELKNKKLADFPGKKLLITVPSLDTPVCSKSAKHFHDLVTQKGIALLVISADLPFAQKRYCGLEGISSATTLSMMRDKTFGRDYGVLVKEGALEGLCARSVILLDENDTVIYSELVSELTEEPNYEKILPYL